MKRKLTEQRATKSKVRADGINFADAMTGRDIERKSEDEARRIERRTLEFILALNSSTSETQNISHLYLQTSKPPNP